MLMGETHPGDNAVSARIIHQFCVLCVVILALRNADPVTIAGQKLGNLLLEVVHPFIHEDGARRLAMNS